MQNPFHDCNIPRRRVETLISLGKAGGEIREETLKEAGCNDDEKEKEYCRLFDHLFQHDEHGPEEAKEVQVK